MRLHLFVVVKPCSHNVEGSRILTPRSQTSNPYTTYSTAQCGQVEDIKRRKYLIPGAARRYRNRFVVIG